MGKWRSTLLVAAVGVCAITTHANATLMLTAAGTNLGFSLSNFLSGGSDYTFLGAANLPDGTLAVGGFSGGTIYKFSDVDGQTLANSLASTSFSGEIDMATAGGQAYAASRNLGFFHVANDLSLTQIVTNPSATPSEGVYGNPANGHLIANTSIGLIDLNPTTGNDSVITNAIPGTPDGVSVSPNGQVAYVAIFGGAAVNGYNIATGTLVFSATGLPGGPDGTAVISGGALDGFIVVNNNDGSVGVIDPSVGTETIIATGGTRGDFVSPDLNNGSLLAFEDDSVWRFTVAGGSIGGGPTPSVPEPMSLALFGIGLAGIGYIKRRRSAA